MKKLVFPLIVALLISCSPKTKFYTLELTEKTDFGIISSNPFIIGDSLLLSYNSDYSHSKFKLLNLHTGRRESFQLPYAVYRLYPLSDSLFLIRSAYNLDNYGADTSLKIINRRGQTVRYFDLKGSPFYTKENAGLPNYNLAYIKDLFVSEGKIFVSINKNTGLYPLNSKELVNARIPIVAYIDLDSGKYHPIDLYQYPDVDTSVAPYADMWGDPYIAPGKNPDEIIITFNYTPTTYVYNFRTGGLKIYRIGSVLVDTINPTISSFFPKYLRMFYSDSLQLYLKRIDYSAGKTGLIIVDTNFNTIGEVVLPKKFYPLNLHGKTLLGHDSNTGKLTGYKVALTTTDKKDFVKRHAELKRLVDFITQTCPVSNGEITLPDENFAKYLGHFYNDTNYSVVIFSLINSCPDCIGQVLYTYALNKKFFTANNIKLLVHGYSKKFIDDYLSNILALPDTVYTADTTLYEQYLGTLSNITFVTIRDGKVKFKKNYQPRDLEYFFNDLVRHGTQ